MYRVALCEDEKVFSEAQRNICRGIFAQLNIEYHISVFENSADCLKAVCGQGECYDLFLLDILMEDMDGINLARRIRETDADAAIIFITSSADYALQGYDVNALNYLLKPIDTEKLRQLIYEDYQRRFANQFFVFEAQGSKQRVAVRDIICLETAGRRVAVTTLKGMILVPGKLISLLEALPREQFIRCHQAYAVNIRNIRELTKQDAIAMDGKVIPVSRTFMKQVQTAFIRQMRGQAGNR